MAQAVAAGCVAFLLSPGAAPVAGGDSAGAGLAPAGAADTADADPVDRLLRAFPNLLPVRPARAQQLDPGATDDGRPADVHRAVTELVAEIELLRGAAGVADHPPEAEPQEDRLPIHAYVKAAEVMKKVARLQTRLGVAPEPAPGMPVHAIGPQDVLAYLQLTIGELHRTKTHLGVTETIRPAAVDGGTIATAYKGLGDASFLLDGLVGHPPSPGDVLANVLAIQDELELIAARLRADLALDLPAVDGRKKAQDVARQVLRALHKVIGLQTRLGLRPSSMPRLTLVRVTPAEALEGTNVMLAELARIKTHLDVRLPRLSRADPANGSLEEAYARTLLVIENLDLLSEAALRVEPPSARGPD